MTVLDHTLVWDWCREHGVPLVGDSAGSVGPITLADDPTLDRRARLFYAEGQRSGREPANAAAAVIALAAWDECLVWVTEWGVWPSGEDWPRFYAWRGAHGERRSLGAAPGHLFGAGEIADLENLLTQILENGWDATLLPALGGAVTDRRVVTSHDEWIDVRSREPVEFSVSVA
jgi:hypothetical protein